MKPDSSESITLSGKVELVRLIDLCAERLRLDIEYDPAAIRGTVTLRIDNGLDDEELWALTNQLLASRGYATISRSGSDTLSVVPIAEAPKNSRLFGIDFHVPSTAGFVTTVIRIGDRPTKEIIEAVRPVLSSGGVITPLGDTALILLADVRPRVDEIVELIRLLDVAVAPPVIERIEAQHVPASQLAALVTAAVTSRNTMTNHAFAGRLASTPDGDSMLLISPPDEAALWKGLIDELDHRPPILRRTYAPDHFTPAEVAPLLEQVARDRSPRGSGDRWRVVTDELTGTLIVEATEEEHAQVVALIARLDASPGEKRRGVRTIVLRNRNVIDVLDVLTRLSETGAIAPPVPPPPPVLAGAPDTEAGAQSPPTRRRADPQPPRGTDAPLQLTADEGTNTLVAVGERRLLDDVQRLVSELDVRQPQVMLEVTLVTLNEGDTLDLGVELEKMEISGNTLLRLSSLFGLGGAGALAGAVLPNAGRGFSGVALSPGDFSLVIRALATLSHGRTVSLPRTLVNNNAQATLDSVLQEPFTSTNASDTVATTSFGGTQDAGTQITVQPQIAAGDHIVLEYTVTVSAFVGESSDPSLPPPRQQNTLASNVTIPDGYTVVLGGLDVSSDAEGVSQVPLLGSLPIIGEAFKSRSNSSSRSRYFVFIRADVLRHSGFEDLKYLSDRNAAAAEVDTGWPSVEPQVIR